MTEEEKKVQVSFITKLLQRLDNEDWSKWLGEEKQSIDSVKTAPDEAATASREVWYEQLRKKILDEARNQ
jgi:hypothetical protein